MGLFKSPESIKEFISFVYIWGYLDKRESVSSQRWQNVSTHMSQQTNRWLLPVILMIGAVVPSITCIVAWALRKPLKSPMAHMHAHFLPGCQCYQWIEFITAVWILLTAITSMDNPGGACQTTFHWLLNSDWLKFKSLLGTIEKNKSLEVTI